MSSSLVPLKVWKSSLPACLPQPSLLSQMPQEPGLMPFLVPQDHNLDYLDHVIILQLPQPLPGMEILSVQQ